MGAGGNLLDRQAQSPWESPFSISLEQTPHLEDFLKKTLIFPMQFPDQEQQQFPAWNSFPRGLCSVGRCEANTHALKTAKCNKYPVPEPGKAETGTGQSLQGLVVLPLRESAINKGAQEANTEAPRTLF